MFKFAHPFYLYWLLILLPLIVLFVYFIKSKQKKISTFGNFRLVKKLIENYSTNQLIVKFVLYCLAIVFIVLGLAGPQIGTKQEKINRKGIDVMVALDVSKSMLAEDIKPNRLLRAKNFVSHFISSLKNDRLGITVFAGKAYLQMPITVDYSSAKMYLKNINTDIVPTQGTAIGDAVAIAAQSFSTDNKNSKALIIISDGEDNETGAEEAVKMAAESGAKVFTIGVGSEEGGPIPLANGDFKRDAEGNVVVTKTNQEALKNLAQLGKGKFYMLYSGNEIVDDILRELGRIESKQFEELIYTEFDSKFQICIAIALFFLIIEWLLIERRLAIWDFLKLKKK